MALCERHALVPSMDETLGSSVAIVQTRNCVQFETLPRLRKCKTRVQLEALEALRTLQEPFSVVSAAEQLGWDYVEARHWIYELSARGYLVGSRRAPKGHTWTEEGRAA